MTAQDRELWEALTRRHERLEESVALLKSDLAIFHARLDAPAIPVAAPVLPPLPVFHEQAATPPPIPQEAVPDPIVPPAATFSTPFPTPLTPESAAAKVEQSLRREFQFGRWLARIGVVFALITLISFSLLVRDELYAHMGPWCKLAVLAFASLGLIGGGFWLERRSADMLVYARTLAGGGLACLYYTLYGATYVEQLRVIPSALFGGFLLLAWSACVLWLAEARKSELLSVFAIALAYFSSAITPVGEFTMVANLLLALTAVIFLVRNAWTGLSYLCLIGTYAGFLRQIVANTSADPFTFHFIPVVAFTPLAVYLAGAWLIFTAGIFFAKTPAFAAGKRMAFLCLNNGAFAGLLVTASHLAHYGHIGGIAGAIGVAFLAAYGLACEMRTDETDIAGAYLMQGLAFATGGIAIAYTGVTRGLLITTESVFLAAAGAYSRNLIFRIAGCVSAALGVFFLIVEIGGSAPYPWILTFGGALAMLANALLARRDFWSEPPETAAARFVLSSGFYILLALALLFTGIVLHAGNQWLVPDLALCTLVLTAAIYIVPIFELPPLSQALLVIAQIISFFGFGYDPTTGWPYDMRRVDQLHWSQNVVALVTMLLVTWWPWQKLVRTKGWLTPLLLVYALAMVAFGYNAVHPHVDAQTWMIIASFLSLVFLAYGSWSRIWQFAIAGQIFLALSVVQFLGLPDLIEKFPWTWWAAGVPPLVVGITGWLARVWLVQFSKDANLRKFLLLFGRIYQCVAIGLCVRWIFGIVPDEQQTLTFFAVGTGLLLANTRWPSAFGIRAAFVFDLVGGLHYLGVPVVAGLHAFTWPDGIGFVLFLAQPAILRQWGRELVSIAESWTVIITSSTLSWFFVSNSVYAMRSHNLTLAWALFAVALTALGFVANERRQRWCGLAILVAAFVRVAVYDFWRLSDLYKMLTFLVLTVICLGLSFLYYKFADRLKEWL
jgi:Predicted membrane protein (DUF2339)